LKNRAILPEKSAFLRPASPLVAEFWQPIGSQFKEDAYAESL
jgi:hypothetical protein